MGGAIPQLPQTRVLASSSQGRLGAWHRTGEPGLEGVGGGLCSHLCDLRRVNNASVPASSRQGWEVNPENFSLTSHPTVNRCPTQLGGGLLLRSSQNPGTEDILPPSVTSFQALVPTQVPRSPRSPPPASVTNARLHWAWVGPATPRMDQNAHSWFQGSPDTRLFSLPEMEAAVQKSPEK